MISRRTVSPGWRVTGGWREKPTPAGVPALATVGLTEAAARTQGLRFRTTYADTSDWFTSRRVGETTSGYKVLVEEESHRLLGTHLFGPHAEEVINLFAMAIRCGIRAPDLQQVLCAYPTSASDVVHMLEGRCGVSHHGRPASLATLAPGGVLWRRYRPRARQGGRTTQPMTVKGGCRL